MLNLDDTSACPDNGGQCEACGRRPAQVATHTTPAGVCCLARCEECSGNGILPALWSAPQIADRVAAHAHHPPVGAQTQPATLHHRWAR
jgi:hypothetical protein